VSERLFRSLRFSALEVRPRPGGGLLPLSKEEACQYTRLAAGGWSREHSLVARWIRLEELLMMRADEEEPAPPPPPPGFEPGPCRT